MAKTWNDLGPRTKTAILTVVVFDTALKAVALADLARRPSAQVRGPKPLWAAGLVLVNSVGVLPVMYFTRGRRTLIELAE